MPTIKVRKNFAINIPAALRENIKEGGYMDLTPTDDGGFRARPVKTVPAVEDDIAPWQPEEPQQDDPENNHWDLYEEFFEGLNKSRWKRPPSGRK